MNEVITCDGVAFAYNGQAALHNLCFSVQKGQVFALLGPNGAGKTTTIRILNGLLRPSAGHSRVLGLDPVSQGAQIRHLTGVLTETPALYERLTAWQNLNFFGSLSDMSPAQIEEQGRHYLEIFELDSRAGDKVESYSKGMKQRLALARALLHSPELVFLDEPTSGMDPAAARQVEELIYTISKRENRSVILCTHRLYEAEKVCDQVAIMQKGTILAIGTLAELRRQYTPEIKVRFGFSAQPDSTTLAALKQLAGVLDVQIIHPQEWELRVDSEAAVPGVVNFLVERNCPIQSVVPCQAKLEDIYLKIQELGGKVRQ